MQRQRLYLPHLDWEIIVYYDSDAGNAEEIPHTLDLAPTTEARPRLRLCNITQACRYLGISQPTFRKLVSQSALRHDKQRGVNIFVEKCCKSLGL